jgi:hypothetical protein
VPVVSEALFLGVALEVVSNTGGDVVDLEFGHASIVAAGVEISKLLGLVQRIERHVVTVEIRHVRTIRLVKQLDSHPSLPSPTSRHRAVV